jgi:hypothetical protein
MSYTVIWRHVLQAKLAELYVTAREQGQDAGAITRAVAEIDRLLRTQPGTRGESRADQERVLFVPPLTVTFEVHEEERIVYVLTVHRPRPPRKN